MISILFLVFIGVVAASQLNCAVNNVDKIDCGYYGIDQSGCESKGCCWVSSSVSGIPWCFYQAGVGASSCFVSKGSMELPFTSSEVNTMRQYFLANINIQGKGGVVAAPDYNTPDEGGSYYYHWMRDAALTIRTLQETNPSGNFSDVETSVKSYVNYVLNGYGESDPNGQDVRTEPKFMLPNGEVFSDPWCRPQNDGPGLTAYSLILAAESLLSLGQSSYVSSYLWTGSDSVLKGGAIKNSLDYMVGGWASNTCDLWEEIRDADFFWNRITMKKSLIKGAEFASRMGAPQSTVDSYLNTMRAINSTLYSSHWNGAYIQECGSRTRDSAVIVGLNDGYDSSDDMFGPASYEVAKTVSSYNTMFCKEYNINTADSSSGLPGVLYGRYQGDNYAGGNPWVLSTAALASLLYRGASSVLTVTPSPSTLSVWEEAFQMKSGELSTILSTGGASSLAQAFAAQGDGVLLRLRSHVMARAFHLDEQIDRNTGNQMSAKDLTWSYAEVLNAMNYRGQFLKQLSV